MAQARVGVRDRQQFVDISDQFHAHAAKSFEEPFSYIINRDRDNYYAKQLYHPHVGANMKTIQLRNAASCTTRFPHNIEAVYYYEIGWNDGDDWRLIGVLDDGTYFYFEAGCDYTGFDCQGFMRLYLSMDMDDLLDRAVKESVSTHVRRFQHMLASADPTITMKRYHARATKFEQKSAAW